MSELNSFYKHGHEIKKSIFSWGKNGILKNKVKEKTNWTALRSWKANPIKQKIFNGQIKTKKQFGQDWFWKEKASAVLW